MKGQKDWSMLLMIMDREALRAFGRVGKEKRLLNDK
jgi:hypothetical protein